MIAVFGGAVVLGVAGYLISSALTPKNNTLPNNAVTNGAVPNGAAQPQIVGGDRDAHGCIGSAGYSWCAAKNKCLRPWEEPCEAAGIPSGGNPSANTPKTGAPGAKIPNPSVPAVQPN